MILRWNQAFTDKVGVLQVGVGSASTGTTSFFDYLNLYCLFI